MEKQKCPEIRFSGFDGKWIQRNWRDTVEISTNMVDPRSNEYGELFHIGPGNIKSFSGQFYDNVLKVKDSNLISGKFYFRKGDIIYGKINPQLAKYVIAPFEGLASADAYVLNTKNGVVQNYLYAILQTNDFYKYTVSVSSRTGMPKINRDELNIYNYFSPSEAEQTLIGEFFQNLDQSITLHEKKLAQTQKFKKAMLEKMFPKQGSKRPEIRLNGFSGDWIETTLGNLGSIRRGASPRPIEDEKWFDKTSRVGWLRISDVSEQNGRIYNIDQKLSLAGQQKTLVLDKPHLILSIAATVGKPVINYVPTGIHDGFIVFLDLNADLEFMFQWLEKFRSVWFKLGQSGSQLNLNSELVKSQRLYLPLSKDEQIAIGQFFKKIDETCLLLKQELHTLNKLKQALLEKMFV